jgi:hypothetical protein
MAVTVRWHDCSKTILFFTFTGHWTWEEFAEAVHTTIDMTKDRTGTIPVLIDMSASKNIIPPNITTRAAQTSELAENHLDPVIVIGASKMWQVMVNVLRQLGNTLAQRVTFVETLEEAEAVRVNDSDGI